MLGCHFVVFLFCCLQLLLLSLPPTATAIPAAVDSEAAWWGLWPVTYLPFGLGFVFVAINLAFVILIWRSHVPYSRPAPATAFRNFSLLALLIVLGCYLFPVAHTRWGDAFMISRGMAWPDIGARLIYSWQAPLDVMLHSRLWLLLHNPMGWIEDASGVYRLLSPLAGALYLYVALMLSRINWPGPGWLSFGLLCSLGLMQLFFGYVENYSFAAAGILAYLWLGIRVIRGESRLWHAALVLGLTMALHPSTVVLAPSMLYLMWSQSLAPFVLRDQRVSLVQAIAQVALPISAIFIATVTLMEVGGHGVEALFTTDRPGGGDARWFVPLFEAQTRWEHYTMFSWLHLRDFLNEQMLVAPVVLPGLLIVTIGGRLLPSFLADDSENYSRVSLTLQRLQFVQHETRFLSLAAAFYLFFTWVWNPDYGGQRDWDLFCLAAIPTTLLLSWRLPMLLVHRRTLAWSALPLIAFQTLHTISWIYQNTLPWQWPD